MLRGYFDGVCVYGPTMHSTTELTEVYTENARLGLIRKRRPRPTVPSELFEPAHAMSPFASMFLTIRTRRPGLPVPMRLKS